MAGLELCVVELDTERRWNFREWFDAHVNAAGILGRFLSYRDDDTFIWLQRPESRADLTDAPPRRRETTRRLMPIARATEYTNVTDSPLIEIRQYRLVPGTRARFADFLIDRTLEAQTRAGMAFHGPFDDLDDENVLTWFRGFPSLAERDRRKAEFYQGRYWLEELETEAFSMIEDYRNTMLVVPV